MRSFVEKLKSFVFFHLGSDAELTIDSEPEQIKVHLTHQRIHSFQFDLSVEKAGELASTPESFEDYMLDLLTQHRKTRSSPESR